MPDLQDPDPATTHQWVGASMTPLTLAQAKRAFRIGWLTAEALYTVAPPPPPPPERPVGEEEAEPEPVRVTVLDVLCRRCSRSWEEVADQPCVALQGREHLRGGPIGERKKRKGGSLTRPGVDIEVLRTAYAAT